jgi:hypothetical protein
MTGLWICEVQLLVYIYIFYVIMFQEFCYYVLRECNKVYIGHQMGKTTETKCKEHLRLGQPEKSAMAECRF